MRPDHLGPVLWIRRHCPFSTRAKLHRDGVLHSPLSRKTALTCVLQIKGKLQKYASTVLSFMEHESSTATVWVHWFRTDRIGSDGLKLATI